MHKDRAHFGIKYSCPDCKHRATRAATLKIHIEQFEQVSSPLLVISLFYFHQLFTHSWAIFTAVGSWEKVFILGGRLR